MSKVASSSLVGRLIDGRYRVQSRIAGGGMGTVFVAIDERLDREVALKVMRSDLARDEAFVARFRREARSAARLSHPNVVSVYDQGRDGDYVFLAMELVRGRTLRDVIRAEAPLTARASLDVFESVLRALAAAHHAGIIHRDVKPENVLISNEGRVKVADFGLARAVTTDTLTTNSDVLLGTAAYLSPEQVERGTVDRRSDVYSAGLVLFEMLTGEKAYPGDSPIHVAYQHVHGAVPRPSDAVATVPTALDDLVALASAKDPEQRPGDATQMLADLRQTRAELGDVDLDHAPGSTNHTDPLSAGSSTQQLTRGTSTSALHRPARAVTSPGKTGGPQPPGRSSRSPRSGASRAGRAGGTTPRPARRRRRPGWWIAAGLAALLATGGVVAAWWVTLGPGSTIAVPNVAGQSRGVAVRTIGAAGLAAQVREVFSETVPRDRVVTSLPGPGTEQAKSDAVVLEVSKGKERYLVPSVAGSTQEAATTALRGRQLAVGEVSEAFSETVPSGQVVSSAPESGTELKKGTTVDLVISKGREPIAVPVVTDQTTEAARSTIADAGLQATLAPREFSDTVPEGTVISQTPSSGTVYRGDTIELVVSKGPQMVAVPKVIDLSASKARSTLEAAGLKVKINRVFGGFFDTVRDQNPPAGTKVRVGTEVTISVV